MLILTSPGWERLGILGTKQCMWKIAVLILMHYWKHGKWSNKPRCTSRNVSLIWGDFCNHKILKSIQNPRKQLVTNSGLVRTATRRLWTKSWCGQVARRWHTATIGAKKPTGSSTRRRVRMLSRKTTKSELVEDLHQLSNQAVNIVFLNFDFRLHKVLAWA